MNSLPCNGFVPFRQGMPQRCWHLVTKGEKEKEEEGRWEKEGKGQKKREGEKEGGSRRGDHCFCLNSRDTEGSARSWGQPVLTGHHLCSLGLSPPPPPFLPPPSPPFLSSPHPLFFLPSSSSSSFIPRDGRWQYVAFLSLFLEMQNPLGGRTSVPLRSQCGWLRDVSERVFNYLDF